MSSTRTLLRMVAENSCRRSPAEVLARVNHMLLKDFPRAKFVTMVYALLDPKSGSIVFANAGHLPPLLADSSGAHYLETETGLPLGTRERSFSERTIEMTAGSRLIFHLDGVTEAMNSLLEENQNERIHIIIQTAEF